MHICPLIITLLIFSTTSIAGDSIHYFDLQNRPANEVIPLIKPLLLEKEAASGDGYQLFIKTSPKRAEEIENLLSAIDRAIKTFRISVTSDEYTALEENSLDASVKIKTGDADIQVGKHPRKDQGVTVHADTRYTEDKSDKTQFVRVQEGKPAFVSKEKVQIVPIYSYVQRPNGDILIEHSYPSSSSQDGFYVTARSPDGESATVSIQSATSSSRSYQGYGKEQTYVDTSLRVPLGKWFEIGGNSDSYQSETKGILYRSKKNEERYTKVFLKIELQE